MNREKKLRAIRLTLGHEQIHKGNEFVFLCSKCKHHKPKLSVNLETDIFHCWVCGWAGKNIVPLLPKNSSERREYVQELEEKSLSRPIVQEKKYDNCVLPEQFKTLSREHTGPYYSAAMSYLSERGIRRDDILKWKLGYCESGEYKYRIIIPSFDEYGHLNFFTGRSFYGNPLRYHTGNLCKDIIWNDYLVDWNKSIVITEGPFDAFKVNDNVIALQGSILNISSKLFSKIVFSGVDVYFAMDKDAFSKQLKIIETLFSYGVDCYYVPTGNKNDVGEMTKSEFITAKSHALSAKSSTDLLRLRILS